MLVGRSHVGKMQKQSLSVGEGGVKSLRTVGEFTDLGGISFAGRGGQYPIICHVVKNINFPTL